ncbi:MAG: DUF4397 domain-containing protein [Sporichthyaceae bacterium]
MSASPLRRCTALLATTGVLLAPTLAAPAGAAESGEGTVTVFHGVPDLTVDVYANGKKLLPDFEPGDFSPATDLPAGDYDIDVFPAGEGPDGEPAITENVTLPAGANATIAAHLDADGKPALTTFVNDLSDAGDGKGRLTVRHVAAAPSVDVRANKEAAFKALTNPKQTSAALASGTVSADVVLAGTDTVAIGPADVTLTEGKGTVVYAWGSAEKKNLSLAVQNLDLGGTPNSVPAGFGPSAGGSAIPPWSIALAALAAAGLAVSARQMATARR